MSTDAVLGPRRESILATALRVTSDRDLAEQVHAGSERAFDALFHRYHRPVLAFCERMLGSRDEAEDAVQLTFLAAYRELVRAEPPVAVRPWLYAIARNRCLSMLRTRRDHSMDELRLATSNVADEVARREELSALLRDLAQLPRDQHVALVLTAFSDTPHHEIARELGCPRDKVKALVFQARSSLTASRTARETPCAEIREQLATLRGGALLRATLRRHQRECPSCRAFYEQVRARRRAPGLLPLPVTLWLKRVIPDAVLGSGAGAHGAAATTGALSGSGLAAAALVTLAIPAGVITGAAGGDRDAGEAAPLLSHVAPARSRMSAEPAGSVQDRRRPSTTSPGADDSSRGERRAPRPVGDGERPPAPVESDSQAAPDTLGLATPPSAPSVAEQPDAPGAPAAPSSQTARPSTPDGADMPTRPTTARSAPVQPWTWIATGRADTSTSSTAPATAAEPVRPAAPAASGEPDAPVTPTAPATAAEPVRAVAPTASGEPDAPVTPTRPTTPADPAGPVWPAATRPSEAPSTPTAAPGPGPSTSAASREPEAPGTPSEAPGRGRSAPVLTHEPGARSEAPRGGRSTPAATAEPEASTGPAAAQGRRPSAPAATRRPEAPAPRRRGATSPVDARRHAAARRAHRAVGTPHLDTRCGRRAAPALRTRRDAPVRDSQHAHRSARAPPVDSRRNPSLRGTTPHVGCGP